MGAKELAALAGRKRLIETISDALILHNSGSFIVPDRMHITNGNNTLLLMPCFADKTFSTKIVSVHPDNLQQGKAVIQGSLLLNDRSSGEPLALMNASVITAARTGAIGALAAKHLAAADDNNLGIIGAGVQGLSLALYISETIGIKKLSVYDRDVAAAHMMCQFYDQQFPSIETSVADNAIKALNDSDIIVTATSSNKPVLPEDPQLLQGKTYIAVGSFKPEMQELPLSLFDLVDEIFVDTPFATRESGDLKIPLEKGLISQSQIDTLSSLIAEGKRELGKTRLFKSVGMALLDLAAADYFYSQANLRQIGQRIEL